MTEMSLRTLTSEHVPTPKSFDQQGHLYSETKQSLLGMLWKAKDSKLLQVYSKNCDQTA